MVMPKFPFSLFNFDYIDKFGPIRALVTSAAGDAIPETVIYKVPDHKFALLLSASVTITKTTATSMQLYIKHPSINHVLGQDWLINETLSSVAVSWPDSQPSTDHGLGLALVFLFPGDTINVAQALTLGETISHQVILNIIEYSDPRYEK